MKAKDVIKHGHLPQARRNDAYSLHRDIDRLFDDFFNGFWMTPLTGMHDELRAYSPSLDVRETEKEVKVSVELPGMDEKDVHLSLDDNILTIKGEKKDEQEGEEKGSRWVERSYGSFQRRLQLPEIDSSNVKARFKKGVLTVNLPKAKPEQAKAKNISITAD